MIHFKDLPQSLIGRVVQFNFSGATLRVTVLKVTGITNEDLRGTLIASDWAFNNMKKSPLNTDLTYRLNYASPENIISYRVLPPKELPLLIGYRYTSDLLAQLIKG